MGALKFRDRLTEDARWWANFGLIILIVLLVQLGRVPRILGVWFCQTLRCAEPS